MTTPQTIPDPLHHAMRGSVHAALERIGQDDDWDLDPMLLVVAHGDLLVGTDAVDDALGDDLRAMLNVERGQHGAAMALRITALPTPPFLWSLAGETLAGIEALTRVLGSMRDQVPQILDLQAASRVVGVILVAEAWGINPATATEPLGGSLADHPDRIETRVAVGVDTAGDVYGASQPRGDDAIHEDTRQGRKIGGAIPDALAALLEVLAEDVSAELAEEGDRG